MDIDEESNNYSIFIQEDDDESMFIFDEYP